MILTIISIVLLAIGVILLIMDFHTIWGNDALAEIGIPAGMLGLIGTITCVTFIITANAPRLAEKEHQKLLNQKYVLEERLNTADDSMVVQDWLYDDILEFNNYLYNTKKNLENPWINWFFNAKTIEGIDYIQYGNINWEGE